jgi:type IV pilus assembly protein PilA
MTRRLKQGFTLIELMIVVAIIGILSSVAITGFIRFQQRARQSEVKSNLKAVFTAESAYRAEKDTYSPYFSEIGFDPERGNRYAYYLGTGRAQDRSGAALAVPADGYVNTIEVDTFRYGGVPRTPAFQGTPVAAVGASKTAFTATATANIDTDNGIDSWEIASISSAHTASCGNSDAMIVAGSPYVDYNDTSCN